MVRKRVVLASGSLAVAICRYAPGERHSLHTDTHSRVSFLLRGSYREEGKPGSIRMGPGHVLLKSRRAKHEDIFGDTGADIAAVEFTRDDPFDAAQAPDLWRQRADAFALRHAMAFLDAAITGDANGVTAASIDLVANSNEPSRRDQAPAWLARLYAELEEAPLGSVDVAARAKAAGAHPAHASRLFRRCFANSVTEHAQAHSVRRAMAALAGGVTLTDAALTAGFYDQSHMSRVFKRVTGHTPGRHRALLGGC
jgi:AraC family transcriptional regulator